MTEFIVNFIQDSHVKEEWRVLVRRRLPRWGSQW